MNRIVRVSVIVILLLALAFGLVLAAGGAERAVAGKGFCPSAGWNTRADCYAGEFGPVEEINAGWNT